MDCQRCATPILMRKSVSVAHMTMSAVSKSWMCWSSAGETHGAGVSPCRIGTVYQLLCTLPNGLAGVASQLSRVSSNPILAKVLMVLEQSLAGPLNSGNNPLVWKTGSLAGWLAFLAYLALEMLV